MCRRAMVPKMLLGTFDDALQVRDGMSLGEHLHEAPDAIGTGRTRLHHAEHLVLPGAAESLSNPRQLLGPRCGEVEILELEPRSGVAAIGDGPVSTVLRSITIASPSPSPPTNGVSMTAAPSRSDVTTNWSHQSRLSASAQVKVLGGGLVELFSPSSLKGGCGTHDMRTRGEHFDRVVDMQVGAGAGRGIRRAGCAARRSRPVGSAR